MKIKTSLALLFFFLTACAPALTPAPKETPIQTTVLPTLTATVEIPIIIAPSPTPTQPVISITPDAIQVERWKEYEIALAMKLLPPSGLARTPGEVLCEWEILGRSDQEVYVWAFCQAPPYDIEGLQHPSIASIPAVVHLGADGAVQSVEIPGSGTAYDRDIRVLFPPDVQEIIFKHIVDTNKMEVHINARREIPQPPLVVLSATPTQPIIPVITPDAIQVERWKEYQTELAKLVLSQAGDIFPDYESALCEWDILGRSNQELYVWAECLAPHAVDSRPAVIHLKLDGTIEKVEVPFHDSTWESTIQKLFPTDVQKKIDEYFYPMYSGRAEELRIHLLYRLTHPDVPPLIILSAMPTATITP